MAASLGSRLYSFFFCCRRHLVVLEAIPCSQGTPPPRRLTLPNDTAKSCLKPYSLKGTDGEDIPTSYHPGIRSDPTIRHTRPSVAFARGSASTRSPDLIPYVNPDLTPTSSRPRKPDYEFSLVSALKSCSALSSIPRGRQLHCLVLKSGLDSNIFILNSLMSFYAKCELIRDAMKIFDSFPWLDPISCNIMMSGYAKLGRVEDACEVFDKMPGRNCVSYTTIIMVLVQKGSFSKAIHVFREMRCLGMVPNEVTLGSMISASLHCGGVQSGRMLHGLVLKLGLHGFVHISTNLLHVYCVSGCVRDASVLFNEMPERNVVSWNVMLNGYAKAKLVHLLRELFEKMVDRDVVSWGTVIDGYIQVGRLSEALVLYCQMLRTGLKPNDIMIVDLISACSRAMAISEGKQFHGVALRMGFDSHDFIQATIIHLYAAFGETDLARIQFEVGSKEHPACWNALIAGLIRNGKVDEGRSLFDQMPEQDVFSWSSMISGYSQTEQPGLALELFHEMVESGIKPNEVTMVSVFSAIATLGTFKEGRWAHEYICKNAIPVNDNLSAAIIDMYAKCGSISTALDLFNQIRERATDVSPWNAIICGLAMHGHAELSLDVFSDMERRNIKPNSITFIGVLSACCHAGLVEVGEKHFKRMKEFYTIEPSIKHYGCMVDLFGRAGRLDEAETLIQSMPMEADAVIWGTLLAASKTHGNTEIGKRAAENLARVEPCHGPSRVLLSNIYADAGKWEDAFLVRQEMQTQRLTRATAYSGVV
nr:pentatricopeptide repeat-containing protein At5g19020, mitochondrial [Ipomoea batatas]